jgi:HTH-type transcriptional regulator/antitoxin HigA
MKPKVIKTIKQYNLACARLYNLIQKGNKRNLKEGNEMELLALLIEQYEEQKYKFDSPDPVEAIKFRMEQMNLKQKDIAPLIGGETRVSEILNRTRSLTMKMIYNLHFYLAIPFESLINHQTKYELGPQQKKQLINIFQNSRLTLNR